MRKNFTTFLFLFIGLMGFSQTGNVGIGNTTPVAKLDVAGDIALREGAAIAVSGASPAVVVSLHATNAENSFYRITGSPTGTMTLNSIANGVDGQIIALVNATSIKLNITDNNVANGIRTPTGSPVAIPANGSVTLQYAATPTSRWYITSASSGGVLPDWVKANTDNDPAGTLDSQYVNAKIGIGDFKNGASYGSNLEGWLTIKTPSDGTPSIVNPIKDAGIVIQGEGGTPSIKSRFRLVSNNNGWRDNKATAYLQISNNSNTNFDKSNLTLMSGSSGHDVNFNRFQINSDSTQITDYPYGATPRPSSIFEVISGQNVAKSIFHIKGITSQTGNFMDISSDTTIAKRGNVMTVLSSGNVGIGTATPIARLHVVSPATNPTAFAARFTQTNTTNNRNTFLGLGTENAAWSKASIGFQRIGGFDVGDITFNLNTDAATGSDVSTSDEKVRIKNNGDVQMTGSKGKLWLETNGWSDPGTTGAGIAVDNSSYKQLMIVGNNISGNAGLGRQVGIWDFLKVNGRLQITGGSPGKGKLLISDDATGLASWTNGITFGGGTASSFGNVICTTTIGSKGALILFTGRLATGGKDFSMMIHIDASNNVSAMSAAGCGYNQNGGSTTFDINDGNGSNWYRVTFTRASNILTLTYTTGYSNLWIQGNVAVVSNTQ